MLVQAAIFQQAGTEEPYILRTDASGYAFDPGEEGWRTPRWVCQPSPHTGWAQLLNDKKEKLWLSYGPSTSTERALRVPMWPSPLTISRWVGWYLSRRPLNGWLDGHSCCSRSSWRYSRYRDAAASSLTCSPDSLRKPEKIDSGDSWGANEGWITQNSNWHSKYKMEIQDARNLKYEMVSKIAVYKFRIIYV